MVFGQDRDQLRSFYVDVWRRRCASEPLDALATQVARVIEEHPEYQALLQDAENALSSEFAPEGGQTNPFLHMGMHLAIREQVDTDRPAGIRDAYRRMAIRHSPHDAEHAIMECLGHALWEAQRAGQPPDEQAYLECIRRLAR